MAILSAAKLNAQYEARNIPLDKIDEPSNPERETMDPEDLAALGMNIKAIGLIKPLVVKAVGDRYETVAGHRRLLAMRIVDYTPVPCRVLVRGKVDPLAILVSENAHVEAVNPVEEARFYQRLLDDRCGNDVDALCIAVGRRREFVEDRLLLLRGYPKVIEALHEKRISFAVARELNKITDPNRLLILLDVSINQGASARQVAQWRRDAELQGPLVLPDIGAEGMQNGDGSTVQPYQMKCLYCDGTEEPHMMEYVYLHSPCKHIMFRMLARAAAQQE